MSRFNRRKPFAQALGALLLFAALVPGCGSTPEGPPEGWVDEVTQWRAEREEGLRGEESWLTLVGLHWLDSGENRFGSAADNPIVFPEGTAPALAGTFHYDGERVSIEPADGVEMTIDGQNVSGVTELDDDGDAEADTVRLGRLVFYVLERAGRHAVRVKDPESEVRSSFAGLDWYEIDPHYRVEARFVRFDPPKEIQVPTVVGTPVTMYGPGEVQFELAGESHNLTPLVSDPEDTHFFFIIRDETSGHETYGAGRYFYADLEGDRIVLDFNKAYNMPCVFTPYATCTLPPPGNRLALALEAGEKMYGEHH